MKQDDLNNLNIDTNDSSTAFVSKQSSKKPRKNLIGVAVALVIIATLALVGYTIYPILKPSKTESNSNAASTSAQSSEIKTSNASIDEISNNLVNSANDESDITNNDDSNIATNTSDDASNVGGSVNENNL